MKRLMLVMLCMLLLLCAAASAEGSDNWLETVLGRSMVQETADTSAGPQKGNSRRYAAILDIDSEISEYDAVYDHIGVLDAIDALMEDEDNAALILQLNTPGGSMYEADELYHELMLYKATGRPVYAYMEQECCSAGVYVAMAADIIMAARMSVTGNVGVYMTSYSNAGLYEKLGIVEEYIATGDNKVPGYPVLTDEQRAIYAGMVDECFGMFKDAIAQSRGMTTEQMAPFLDGRLLTALQAKEMGLIDGVCYPEEFYDEVEAILGEVQYKNITPEFEYENGYGSLFPDQSLVEWLEQFYLNDAGMRKTMRKMNRNSLKSIAD